jgi:CRP/FNR family transcriptional regulator, cyclic AMP receptor protein
MSRAAEVGLLDVDPDLGVLLDAARRGQAERELVVRAHRLPVGPWDVSGLARARAEDVGLLIVSGVLASELVDRRSGQHGTARRG